MNLPVALTCGDPNGIGIDISFEAKKELKNKIPFFLIADINHLKYLKIFYQYCTMSSLKPQH